MIKNLLLFILLLVVSSIYGQNDIVWKLDFKNTALGPLSNQELIDEGGNMEWIGLNNNSTIVEDSKRSNVLDVKYPKGTVGPTTNGSQFLKTLPREGTDFYLDYYVKFQDGFDFKLGGKLPGLTSGGSTFTGGTHPDNGEGWSARYMWQGNGKIIVYLYYVEMDGEWGESVPLNVNFQTGKWYRITQRIKLNSNRDANGLLQVWIDGSLVLDRSDIVFRYDGLGLIDSFYFSTFHGGSSSDWAPSVDSYISFDNIVVSGDKPDFSENNDTSTNIWKSYNVGDYSNIFNVEFDMVPNNDYMDGVTGILKGVAANYSDLSCIVRFNTLGYIDSYDTDAYKADEPISYLASDNFHVKMQIDADSKTYDVYISKNEDEYILLASNYGFRNTKVSLDTWAIKAEDGSHTVTNVIFKAGGLSNEKHQLYNVSLYPNTFSNNNTFTLQISNSTYFKDLKLSLVSLDGKLMEEQILKVRQSSTLFTFDSLLSAKKGMYLIMVEGQSINYNLKILKL